MSFQPVAENSIRELVRDFLDSTALADGMRLHSLLHDVPGACRAIGEEGTLGGINERGVLRNCTS